VAEDRAELRVTSLPPERIEFPVGFIWGTAAAAHQAEGGNWNNDWWAWEHDPRSPCVEPSGDAIDHFHRYDSDFALLASYGHRAHRFSIEWSRIEPEEGEFSQVALDHYARVLDSLHSHGLTPFMTLHHFSSPRWLAADGGWANPKVVDRFRRFTDVVAQHLGDRAPYVCTINEPQIVAFMGYQLTVFPPGAGDRSLFWPVTRNFIAAHQGALETFKSHAPDAKVGITLAVSDYQAADEGAVELRDRIHHRMVQTYYDAIRTGWVRGPDVEEEIPGLGPSTNDFVGVQFYSRTVISKDGPVAPSEGAETTQMGYEVVPESFVTVLKGAVSAGVPVFVTENGIGTDDDKQRIRYLATHLASAKRAIDDGVDLRGYIYWCAIDNFEWALGFRPTFGLIACDRKTFERIPKPSAEYFAEICRTNVVDPETTASYL
jgi:beta-glucosidase